MNILISNDDGIRAEGIARLAAAQVALRLEGESATSSSA